MMNSVFFCVLLLAANCIGQISSVSVFLSSEDSRKLFVLPALLADPNSVLKDAVDLNFTFPVIVSPVPNDTQYVFLAQYIAQKNDSEDYAIQTFPVKGAHVTWKNNPSLVRDCPLQTHWPQDESPSNFSILAVCSSARKYYWLIAQLRLKPTFISDSLVLIHPNDGRRSISIDFTVAIVAKIERSRWDKVEIEDDGPLEYFNDLSDEDGQEDAPNGIQSQSESTMTIDTVTLSDNVTETNIVNYTLEHQHGNFDGNVSQSEINL